ncbi:MAG: MFS transporter [Gemmatimonadetes bacterium]|nr:MFS transporter [Gemmatimonadota bacterium]
MKTATLQNRHPDPSSQKLPVLEKIGFGAGDAAVNVVWSALAIIITFFYTDVYRLRVEHIAMLGLIPRLIDAFADVLMGMFTDSHSTRWGRYRPYLLFLAVPFGITVMLVFTTPDLSYNGKLIWAYATYILMMLVFTSIVIPYISLPGVLTADPKERLSANGYRLFFAKGASLVVNIFVPMFAASYAAKWGDTQLPKGYQIAMGTMAVMATLLFIFCFFTTTERVVLKSDRKPIGEQLNLLFHNSQWLILAIVCILMTVGYVLRGSVGLYYAKYFLGGDAALQSAFVTVGIVGNILSMVASTWITKVYCKIQLFRWCQLLTFALSIGMFLAVSPGADDRAMAFVLYFIINFVVDLQGPVFWSIISEAVDYGQVKSGKRVTGMAFGAISWCQKMGMSLAAGMAGWILTYYAYVANKVYDPAIQQDMFTLRGIALMLTIIPGLFHLATGLLMFGYFITDKYYAEHIQDKLAALQLEAEPALEAPVA